jgi:Protein of unknown function (Hypoth_ymh)
MAFQHRRPRVGRVHAGTGAARWTILVGDVLQARERSGRRAVEIADAQAALKTVQAFIVILERGEQEYSSGKTAPYILPRRNNEITERLPLIVQIAARVDAELPAKLQEESDGWPFHHTLKAARQLAGLLKSTEDIQKIFGPVGPKLSAANLHPWIWNAAVGLWDNGHRREAIQAAAQALFDHHLPEKLGVPPARSAKDLIAQAFSTQAPTAGNPRFRLDDYPDPSASWTSQHEGGQFFGMGCAQLIRNLVTHGAQPDEQTGLEQLASLSLLARLIERAKVATV